RSELHFISDGHVAGDVDPWSDGDEVPDPAVMADRRAEVEVNVSSDVDVGGDHALGADHGPIANAHVSSDRRCLMDQGRSRLSSELRGSLMQASTDAGVSYPDHELGLMLSKGIEIAQQWQADG